MTGAGQGLGRLRAGRTAVVAQAAPGLPAAAMRHPLVHAAVRGDSRAGASDHAVADRVGQGDRLGEPRGR